MRNMQTKVQIKIQKLNSLYQKLIARLQKTYTVRLISGLLTLAVIIFLSFQKVQSRFLLFILVLSFFIFLFLVYRTFVLRAFQKKIGILIRFYSRQLSRIKGIAAETILYENKNSMLGKDLDLYGTHSLFTQISECITDIGVKKLSDRIENSNLDVEKLLKRQTHIEQLSHFTPLIRRFFIDGWNDLKPHTTATFNSIIQGTLISETTKKQILALISVWFLAVAVAIVLPGKISIMISTIFWIGSYFVLNKLGQVFFKSLALESQNLPSLITRLESLTHIPVVQKICPHIFDLKPSKEFKSWKTCTELLSFQTNPIFAIILNLLIPWSLFLIYRLEQIRAKLSGNINLILDDLSEFEFFSSLAVMYKYQSQTFSDYTATPYFECEQLFHPLILREKTITNDFYFNNSEQLCLITGSNMSGKSTFIRTIGINQLLACMGAPVFASKFVTYPSQLQTCIRISDSIEDGASYFYAEVLRLKRILNQVKTSPTFFLIDEMFRGTNNQERLTGARTLLSKLITPTSLGFVTTHDLELSQMNTKQIVNWHFSDDYKHGKMYFSYKIKNGSSSTTNALKIMKNEGLI